MYPATGKLGSQVIARSVRQVLELLEKKKFDSVVEVRFTQGNASQATIGAGASSEPMAWIELATSLDQQDRIPEAVRDLVLDDQQRRSAICWNVFDR